MIVQDLIPSAYIVGGVSEKAISLIHQDRDRRNAVLWLICIDLRGGYFLLTAH